MTESAPPDPFRERLIAFLDGTLSASEAREVADRLAHDPEARRLAEEHRAVWRMLEAYPDEPVPADFAARAREAARAGDAESPPSRPAFALLRGGGARRAAIAASIVVAVGAGVLLGRTTAPDRPEPGSTAIEPFPEEVLSSEDLAAFATLSDEDFEVILAGNPDDLAAVARGG